MKKLCSILAVIICISLFPVSAFADSSKTEISFKVGDETLKINEKDIKVQKPYVVNGVTLVPLRVITEAFGAEVIWNGDERSITLKYGNKVIKLFVGKKQVLVDGQETTIPEAPQITNGVTMVPLRFVTENFGADVKYDDKTKQINVVKEIAGDKSIKDFSLILKKTSKTKVGDSYYKWSMNFPKGLKIVDRSFDGTYTDFSADDESYGLYVSIEKNKGETLDTLMASERDESEDYTLVSQTKDKKDGIEYAKTVVRSTYVYDVRYYIADDKIYTVTLYAKDYDKYKDTTTYTSILDSFSINFVKNDTIEDLSDINAEGYRSYSDKNLKFSIDVLPEWHQIKNEIKPNTVEFFDSSNDEGEYYDSLEVDMYSKEDGFTLDGWKSKVIQEMADELNPQYYKVLKQEDGIINGVNCKKVYYYHTIGGDTRYSCDVFLSGEKYKYNVYYHIASETYNDKAKLTQIEKALDSFEFTEPDSSKVGTLTSPRDVIVPDTKVTKKSSTYKWSVELPTSWIAGDDNNDKDEVSYGDGSKSFQMMILKNMNLTDFTAYLDEEFEKKVKLGTLKDIDKRIISDKDTLVYKYNMVQIVGNEEINDEAYILSKNGYLYIVDFLCPVIMQSEKNKILLQTIWQSMKFE